MFGYFKIFEFEKKFSELFKIEKELHVFQFSQILIKICAYKGLGIKLCREANRLETRLGFFKNFHGIRAQLKFQNLNIQKNKGLWRNILEQIA